MANTQDAVTVTIEMSKSAKISITAPVVSTSRDAAKHAIRATAAYFDIAVDFEK